MKKLLPALLTAALAVSMALAAVVGVSSATARIAQINSPLWRTAATFAELVAGTVWLLATVLLATRLAVLIFQTPGSDDGPET